MRNLQLFKAIQLLTLILLISFFGVFYWQTTMTLPLFGDATIHGYNAKVLLEQGWQAYKADYPSLYSYTQDVLYVFFDEKGFNAVPFFGFLFLLMSTFLFIRQITKNYFMGLLSVVFVGCSPKLIFYTARMYQEILISSFFIFSIYLLFKFIAKKNYSTLFLLSFFVGISLSLKQQGLFILYPSIVGFFFLNFLRKKIKLGEFLYIFLIPLFIGLGFYGVLFHNTGVVHPGSEEFVIFRVINNIGKIVFQYSGSDSNDVPKLTRIDDKLAEVEAERYSTGVARVEEKHIWPTDVFTNFVKFNQANSLYLDWEGRKLESEILLYVSFVFLIAGLGYCLINFTVNKDLLFFSAIFIVINYLLFSRNTDQPRYHLFIPIYLLVFIFLFLNHYIKKINFSRHLRIFTASLIVILLFIPILHNRVNLNKRWGKTQLYASSIGGTESIIEVGNWFKKNTDIDVKIGQQCSNETRYYSDRSIIGDWRIYFIPIEDLKKYFKEKNIHYYVIYKSQIVPDKQWISLCWIPQTFYETMETHYKRVFTSPMKDVYVYEIE